MNGRSRVPPPQVFDGESRTKQDCASRHARAWGLRARRVPMLSTWRRLDFTRGALVSSFIAALIVGHASDARADSAWLPSTSLTPLAERVAIAIGPQSSTLWMSVDVNA